ncbi:MAG: type II toxin-antitoxin system PemK/MazF family toxin [Candidatus Paceibacterota bacterium]
MRKRKVVPHRGDIFLVSFDPTVGSEIKKTRPALVIQNNIANTHSPLTIVAAITSLGEKRRLYPTEVGIKAGRNGLDNDSVVLLNQIRTVDKQRLIQKIGKVHPNTLQEINSALEISLGLIEL